MRQSISSNVSNFVAELAEQRNSVWGKYRNSLTFVTKLKELEAQSPDLPAIATPLKSINVLSSGQAPEEIRLAISEIEAELETVKLLEAEIEGIEKEIKGIQGTYILCGLVFLLIGVGIWLWHIGWFVQAIILLIVLFALFSGKKK